MKKVIKRIMYRNRYSSEAYISYLRKKGAYIGEHTRFINPVNTYIDDQCISYISIGRKCCIAAGVTILAHDWSVCVVAEKFGQMLPGQKRTIIGNNVFVGMHTIILSETDGLANHLRADTFALRVRTDGEDMNHSHPVVGHLLSPVDGVIVLALIHRDSHRADDDVIFSI